MKELINNYRKYKWFLTSSGKLVVGGKNASQNDELLNLVMNTKKDLIVMHTRLPGSPFSVILDIPSKVSKDDMEETAIFTACFSQQWKSGKKRAEIDMFRSSQLAKPNNVKTGTWQVLGKVESVSVPLELYLVKQKEVLRAVPEKAAKNKALARIIPGRTDKNLLIPKIELELNEKFSQNEILNALPAGGIKVEEIK